jgi:hypothetical protein
MATFWSTQTICVMFSNGGGNTCAWTLDANRAALVINAVAQTRRARAAASWRDFDGGRPGRERVVLRRAATPQRRSARAIAIGPITFSFHLSNQTAACLSHAGRPSQAQLLAACSGCALPHETVRPCVNGSTPLRRSDVMSGRPTGKEPDAQRRLLRASSASRSARCQQMMFTLTATRCTRSPSRPRPNLDPRRHSGPCRR